MSSILVVDDDDDIRDLLKLKLTASGYQVLTAKDGLEGLHQASKHPIDLIVLDVMMPKLGGIETLRRLRIYPATADTPVMLLTTCSRPAEVKAGKAAGANAYLTKPFSPQHVSLRIAELLNADTPRSA